MVQRQQARTLGLLAAGFILLAALIHSHTHPVNSSGAPSYPFQLPFTIGEAWVFNGVHNDAGCPGNNCTPTDMSAIDFSYAYPFPNWGADTGERWVVAAAPGIPRRLSDCGVAIHHADGWETQYQHLENIQDFSAGYIAQNERLGVLANTEAEATCEGGSAVGIHVHFSLWRNGAPAALDGLKLSDWTIHTGRRSYDTNCNFMWLARETTKKCVGMTVLNDIPAPPPPTPLSGSTVWDFRQSESGWAPNDSSAARLLTPQGMRYLPGGHDAALTSPILNLTDGVYNALYLTMTSNAGTCGRIYFRRAADTDFAVDRRVDFAPLSDNQEHTYIIPLAEHPLWSTEVVQLRLEPACGFGSLAAFTLIQITLQADAAAPTPTPLPTPVPTLPPTLYIPELVAPAPDAVTDNRTPTFRWNTAENAARYHLQLGTTNPPTVVVANTLFTSYTPPTALLPGTYYWRVRSLDPYNRPSEWSAVRSVQIRSSSSAAPSPNLYTTRTPTLTWNSIPWAARYRVQVDDRTSFISPVFDQETLDGEALSMTINPLPNGVYYWRVRAQRPDGSWGGWSSTSSFTINVP